MWAWATAAPAATPTTTRRTCARGSESSSPERRTRRARAGRSRRTACATRGASRATGRRATSTSATWARVTGRRSTCAPRHSNAAPTNYGWRVWEGRARYTAGQKANPRGAARLPDRRVQPRRRLLDYWWLRLPGQGGPVGEGPLLLRRLLQRHDLEPAGGQAGKLRGVRREPFRVPSLSSFGEDAAASSTPPRSNGQIYKLSR